MHPQSEQQTGTLYVVATPIGNLTDITERAKTILQSVDMIACEDTRHTGKLLHHLNIQNRLVAVHDHNERDKIDWLASCLEKGQSIALVSDAGTPLISDPGYPLVSGLRERGMSVQPVPGASAIITALSGAGLPTDRFTFEGFLAHKSGAKRERLETLLQETRTMVFYESKHRILDTLKVMIDVFDEVDDRSYDINDPTFFQNVFINKDPGFIDVSRNVYALDTVSQATDQGTTIQQTPIDIIGYPRLDGQPDLGAYERKF